MIYITIVRHNPVYKKYNFCYHNITFWYPLLTKKLYSEGGGASLSTFQKFQKIYFLENSIFGCSPY